MLNGWRTVGSSYSCARRSVPNGRLIIHTSPAASLTPDVPGLSPVVRAVRPSIFRPIPSPASVAEEWLTRQETERAGRAPEAGRAVWRSRIGFTVLRAPACTTAAPDTPLPPSSRAKRRAEAKPRTRAARG
jgi:hypothetical protein